MCLYLSNWFQRNYGIIQQARGRQLCMQFNRCQNPCEKLVCQGWGQTRHLTHSFYRGLLNTCFGLHCSSCWGQSSEQHSKNSLHSSDGRYNKPDNSVKKTVCKRMKILKRRATENVGEGRVQVEFLDRESMPGPKSQFFNWPQCHTAQLGQADTWQAGKDVSTSGAVWVLILTLLLQKP